ncbi:MAG: hypothetical protein ACR2JM_09325, partial [Mycobacterium sp.]
THPTKGQVEFESEKSDQAPVIKLAKNVTPQHGGARVRQKNKQQTKTTKHTIEFSNNTPADVRPQGNPASVLPRVVLGQIEL